MDEIMQHEHACRVAAVLFRPMSSLITKMTWYWNGRDYWFFDEYK